MQRSNSAVQGDDADARSSGLLPEPLSPVRRQTLGPGVYSPLSQQALSASVSSSSMGGGPGGGPDPLEPPGSRVGGSGIVRSVSARAAVSALAAGAQDNTESLSRLGTTPSAVTGSTTVMPNGAVLTRKKSISILEHSSPSSRRTSVNTLPSTMSMAIASGTPLPPESTDQLAGSSGGGTLGRQSAAVSGTLSTPSRRASSSLVPRAHRASLSSGPPSNHDVRRASTSSAGYTSTPPRRQRSTSGRLSDMSSPSDAGPIDVNVVDDLGETVIEADETTSLTADAIFVTSPSVIAGNSHQQPDYSPTAGFVGATTMLGTVLHPLPPLMSANSLQISKSISSSSYIQSANTSDMSLTPHDGRGVGETSVNSSAGSGEEIKSSALLEQDPAEDPNAVMSALSSSSGYNPVGASMTSTASSGSGTAVVPPSSIGNPTATSPPPPRGGGQQPLLATLFRNRGAGAGGASPRSPSPLGEYPAGSPISPASPSATLRRLVSSASQSGNFFNRYRSTSQASSTGASSPSPTSPATYLTAARKNAQPEQPGNGRRGRRMSLGAALMMPPPPRVADRMDFKTLAKYTITALGILYGDVAAAPMFVMKAAFHGGVMVKNPETDILGCLSFMIWITLLLGIVKYCLVVLHADNNGEGGMLALLSLVPQPDDESSPPFLVRHYHKVFLMALLGCAFLLADGLLVPAISMLAALEGFRVIEYATPGVFGTVPVDSWRVYVTVGLMLPLFYVQRFGLGRITTIFPFVISVWFGAIAIIGAWNIAAAPWVLKAFNPYAMIDLMYLRGWAKTLSMLSTVLLVASGLEFLYADLGAFKRRPISISFSFIAAPCTLLSYLGQGAKLLAQKHNGKYDMEEMNHLVHNLFFEASPKWALWPLVLLGLMVSAMGSQSVISGCFALIDQAVALRVIPPVESFHVMGQGGHGTYYVPMFCFTMFSGSVVLAGIFKDSEVLTGMFGFCVSGAMLITSLLLLIVMKFKWQLSNLRIGAYGVIVFFDVLLFIASLVKIAQIAWVALLFAIALFGSMFVYTSTWNDINHALDDKFWTMTQVRQHIRQHTRVKGSGVFVAYADEEVPHVLSLLASRLPALPEDIVLLTVQCMKGLPFVAEEDRVIVRAVDPSGGIFRVLISFGFAERSADVVSALAKAKKRGLRIRNEEAITYYVSRHSVLPLRSNPFYRRWKHKVYEALSRNTNNQVSNLGLPVDRVIEISNVLVLS
ncbi:hypothetical protein H9P43_006372 [Blastocladiella emersonii ATCC 22665]|nr:hypothetical protein H9P43_006372 [Blastocladiella emersonii ATCC 22665]